MSVATVPEVTILAAAKPVDVTSGTLTGKYIATGEDLRAADAPYEVSLNGAGTIRGLGKVTMTGTLHFGGFRMPNQPDIIGNVTLTNAKGSINVQLTGSGGFRTIPNSRFALDASIVSGTGDYANLRGIGTANAVFGKNVLRSITTPSPIGGSLTLKLNLKPPIR
jgi:hypothetical protein